MQMWTHLLMREALHVHLPSKSFEGHCERHADFGISSRLRSNLAEGKAFRDIVEIWQKDFCY